MLWYMVWLLMFFADQIKELFFTFMCTFILIFLCTCCSNRFNVFHITPEETLTNETSFLWLAGQTKSRHYARHFSISRHHIDKLDQQESILGHRAVPYINSTHVYKKFDIECPICHTSDLYDVNSDYMGLSARPKKLSLSL